MVYLTRMANVLMSLSNWSNKAIVWIIILSLLLTLNFTFAREYECPNPSCAFSKSPGCKVFNNFDAWVLVPLNKSCVTSPVSNSYPFAKTSLIDPASFGSETPRIDLCLLCVFGRFSSRNCFSVSFIWPTSQSLLSSWSRRDLQRCRLCFRGRGQHLWRV